MSSHYQAMATETCRCGGSLTTSATGALSSTARERVDEMLTNWRREHDCIPPVRHYDPIPQGTASDHERASTWDHDNRRPIGFVGGTT